MPTILSLEEVRKIIYALPTVQSHTFYLALYSMGLRLREASRSKIFFPTGDLCIFPALGRNGGKNAQYTKKHVSDSGVQGVLRSTMKRLKFKKHVHSHVFRHAYATHLLEANIPIRHVQKILRHKTLQSTTIYLHVTTQAQVDSNEKVSKVMQGVLS